MSYWFFVISQCFHSLVYVSHFFIMNVFHYEFVLWPTCNNNYLSAPQTCYERITKKWRPPDTWINKCTQRKFTCSCKRQDFDNARKGRKLRTMPHEAVFQTLSSCEWPTSRKEIGPEDVTRNMLRKVCSKNFSMWKWLTCDLNITSLSAGEEPGSMFVIRKAGFSTQKSLLWRQSEAWQKERHPRSSTDIDKHTDCHMAVTEEKNCMYKSIRAGN